MSRSTGHDETMNSSVDGEVFPSDLIDHEHMHMHQHQTSIRPDFSSIPPSANALALAAGA